MEPKYAGKTLSEWIAALQSSDEALQCAAALALAELPATADGTAALTTALVDPEPSVQAAARIGLGLDPIPVENRRKMLEGLLGPDAYVQLTIRKRLAWLITPEALSNAESPNVAEIPVPPETKPAPNAATETPEIVIISVPPWWLLVIGMGLCVGIAWLLRTVWWSKWPMAALALGGGVVLFAMVGHSVAGAVAQKRRQRRTRLAWSAFIGGAVSFPLAWIFAAGVVLVDNANNPAVRLLLDDDEWLTLNADETTSRTLSRGKHQVTVQSIDGKLILDRHEIDVTDEGPFVLNVLGGQTYFKGVMVYGGGQESSCDPIVDKWFRVPSVDYLFMEPPDMITIVTDSRGIKTRKERTFITKDVPPRAFVPKKL